MRDDGAVHRARWVPVALLLAAVLTACGTSGARAAAPSAAPPDPVDVCANGVAHRVEVDLADGEDYGDHQTRGLSARQDRLRARIVDAGRAAGGFTPEQVRERARAGCEEMLAADPGPSGS